MGHLSKRGRFPASRSILGIVLLTIFACVSEPPSVFLERNDVEGKLKVLIEGREAFVYRYADTLDLPHYWPLNSPGGRSMLVEKTEPYPHHRSFWFADTVRLEDGRDVSTYNALYSGRENEDGSYGPPFLDRIRHKSFSRLESGPGRALIVTELVWEMDEGRPVLDEKRKLVITSLSGGEYFLDATFTLFASYGDVHFVSDDIHYAWPYLRLESRWSGENGGCITADNGAVGEAGTTMKVARWMDYSHTVEGETAGIAIFQWPDGKDHRWLTREYGCFGPRRSDERSGKPFTLTEGDSISQRVGILVHKGDLISGNVSGRYEQFVEGKDVK